MAKKDAVPRFHSLFNTLIQSLKDLGGSGSIEEISAKASELLDLPDDILSISHNPEQSSRTEFDYQLAWARTYLKKYGLIDNSSRGVWVIVPEKAHINQVDPQDVLETVREQYKTTKTPRQANVPLSEPEDEPDQADEYDTSWRTQLHHTLTKEIQPVAFERLIQRLLRESGFVQVEVTGRSGDGGIDGKGIIRIGGILSFHVLFQCKKYKDTVGPSAVRDFRGALVGRADKGLFVTTGSFTREAMREAIRDGAPPIDLIDGEQLANKLKELNLGVKTEMVEIVTIDKEWINSI